MLNVKLENIKQRLERFAAQSSLTPTQKAWVVCIEEAIQAATEGNYSVGSVILDNNLKIVSRGRNSVFKPAFHSEAHAEMNAITQFETASPGLSKDEGLLFSTLEPCLMCTARILYSGMTEVLFLQRDKEGGVFDQLHLLPPNFRELAARVNFVHWNEDPELTSMAKDLYDIGEEIWNREYHLVTGSHG